MKKGTEVALRSSFGLSDAVKLVCEALLEERCGEMEISVKKDGDGFLVKGTGGCES